MTVCAEQVSGDLSPNTAILVQVVTYDIPGSQAEGTIHHMMYMIVILGHTYHEFVITVPLSCDLEYQDYNKLMSPCEQV